MDEKQEKCFTCSQPIRAKLYEYERYRSVYGLSRTDAADKTQLQNICCRTTAFGQSGVEARIKAAGRVQTINNEIRVTDVKPYPKSKVSRKNKEGPFPRKDVTLAPKYREEMSYQSFGDLQLGIKAIPKRRVKEVESEPEVPITRMSNRDVLGDLFQYKSNGRWSLVYRDTFPMQQEMKEVFTKKTAHIHIRIPILSEQVLATVEIPEGATVLEALDLLATTMVTPRESLWKSISENKIIKAPLHLDRLLEMRRKTKYPSLVDLSTVIPLVQKVTHDKKTKVHTFELFYLNPTIPRRISLEEQVLNGLDEPEIQSLVINKANSYVLTLDTAVITFDRFEVRTSGGITENDTDMPLEAKLQGSRHENGILYLSFLRKHNVFLVVLYGAKVKFDDDFDFLGEAEKRQDLVKLLNSL